MPFLDPEEAKQSIEKYQEMFSHANEGDIYSVNGGQEVGVYLEDETAKPFPQHKPHYE